MADSIHAADAGRPDEETEPRWTHPAVILATGLWLGRAKFMPGTVGALAGLPLAFGVSRLPGMFWQVGAVAVLAMLAVPVCTRAVKHWHGKKDPGAIVLDEIVSLPIAFLFFDRGSLGSPSIWIAGFLLHRVFDISKPPPVRQLERLPQGAGIVADDLAAGAYACLALHGLVAVGWL